MTHEGHKEPRAEYRHQSSCADLKDLVQTIGYQLTAFIGRTDIRTVVRWLHDGVPEALQPRMQAALDITKPIERVESELVEQGFLAEQMSGMAPYRCAAEMLRAADMQIARAQSSPSEYERNSSRTLRWTWKV